MFSKHTIKQFVIFALIGGVGTIAQYLTLIALVEIVGANAIASSLVGFAVGAVVNYFLNYRFTFNSQKTHREAMTKFFIVAAIGAAVNTLLMYIGINILHLYYLFAQVIATVIVLIWNFIANKLWTFRL